ncbi:MAG: hypothetical protein Q4G36_04935 [Paracoccus sp. (in: a-proteobacteria)]|nr:hypothetical protein [Paracoccus sp. (in: a-proteobacteria)]
MNRQDFIIATALVLLGCFLLGWFASWLVGRLTRPSTADLGALDRMAQHVVDTEGERDRATDLLATREAEMAATAEEQAQQLRDAEATLHEARAEIEELRAYIDRHIRR